MYVVVDPAGTPLDRKMTVATLQATVSEAAPAVSTGYFRPRQYTNGVNAASTLNRMYARMIHLSAGTLDRMGVRHDNTTGAAGEVLRLGLYKDSNGRPGALVVDAGTIDLATAAAAVKTVTISTAISTGVYWIAAARQGPSSTAQTTCYGALAQQSTYGVGGWAETRPGGSGELYDAMSTLYVASITGAFPDPFGTPTAGNPADVPLVAVRYT